MFSPETRQLLKKLGVKLGLGVLGFSAAFAANHVGDFAINQVYATVLVALFDDIAEWADTRYQVAQKVAGALRR